MCLLITCLLCAKQLRVLSHELLRSSDLEAIVFHTRHAASRECSRLEQAILSQLLMIMQNIWCLGYRVKSTSSPLVMSTPRKYITLCVFESAPVHQGERQDGGVKEFILELLMGQYTLKLNFMPPADTAAMIC